MKLKCKAGSTSRMLRIFAQDSTSTSGAGLTGLTSASSGLTWYWIREGDASATSVTLASATVGTFTSGGFKEIDSTNLPGIYEIGVPNAAIASGAKSAHMMLKGATNMVPVLIEVELDAVDYQDGVRAGLTALPNASPAANGGLPTVDASNNVHGLQVRTVSDASVIGTSTLTGTAQSGDTFAYLGTNVGATGANLRLTKGTQLTGLNDIAAGAAMTLATGAVTATAIAASALNGKGDWLLASSYTAPDNTDVASALADLVALLGRTDPTTAITALQTTASAINTKLGTPASSVSADIAAVKADTANQIQMTTGTGATRAFTTAALANAPAGAGGGGGTIEYINASTVNNPR